jgi:hypothetical protein
VLDYVGRSGLLASRTIEWLRFPKVLRVCTQAIEAREGDRLSAAVRRSMGGKSWAVVWLEDIRRHAELSAHRAKVSHRKPAGRRKTGVSDASAVVPPLRSVGVPPAPSMDDVPRVE